jgi:hydroxybutyrate-dimer hydrolase
MRKRSLSQFLGLSLVALLAQPITSVLADDDDEVSIVASSLSCVRYDGASDDLLTAGLGKTGLQIGTATYADPNNPTAAELRRGAIYNNYRALTDMTTNGGYGVLFGPNIDLGGGNTLGEGKIAGVECIAFANNGRKRRDVTMMVQIPSSFDPKNACIVAGPSSGSRGVYGAIGTTGEWGLKRGCAVAFTDKGTGSGVHDLQANTINLIDGRRATANQIGVRANFTAPITNAEREAFNAKFPNRFAVKHAHSERNPEKDWGDDVLDSIRFAFFVLNGQFATPRRYGDDDRRTFNKKNTIVIASSVSNGGGASLAAAERDDDGLIDGIVVSEPQVQPRRTDKLTIMRGSTVIKNHGKGLYDYITLANLYQPCAALAASNVGAPFGFFVNPAFAANRCASLHDAGLLAATTLAAQAVEAQATLNNNGWELESNILGPSHYGFQVAPAVSVTYANAHGRFSVLDNVCGFSMGATAATGFPVSIGAVALAQVFATGNGVPPNSGINLINNNNAVGGPLVDPASISRSTLRQDYNADGARCLRALFTGNDENADRVQDGIDEVKQRGKLHGKPAIIVHGRADNLVPVSHSSRPYYGLNQIVEGKGSNLRYYEVTNAQHFEAFLPLAGYDNRFVPLHVYGIQALNMVYAHLKNGTPLAPSQVVRTVPRIERPATPGVPRTVDAIVQANVPPISASPTAANAITFSGNTLHIPD